MIVQVNQVKSIDYIAIFNENKNEKKKNDNIKTLEQQLGWIIE